MFKKGLAIQILTSFLAVGSMFSTFSHSFAQSLITDESKQMQKIPDSYQLTTQFPSIDWAKLGLDDIDIAAISNILEIYQNFQENNDKIWSKDFKLDLPIVLYRGKDHRVLYGFSLGDPQSLGFKSEKLLEIGSGLPNLYRLSQEDLENSNNADYPETKYLVIGYGDEDSDLESSPIFRQWSLLVISGRAGEFLNRQDIANNIKFPTYENDYRLDNNMVSLIILENSILNAGLLADTVEEKNNYLRQFIAVRSKRIQIDQTVNIIDSLSERWDGFWRYITEKYADLAGIISPQEQLSVELADINEAKGPKESQNTFFTRFDKTGFALMQLMDETNIEWRPELLAGKTPYQIIDEQFDLDDPTGWLNKAKEEHNFNKIRNISNKWLGFTAEEAADFLNQKAKTINQFVNFSGKQIEDMQIFWVEILNQDNINWMSLVAKVLDLSEDELFDKVFENQRTIADIALEKGINLQKVIDTLIQAEKQLVEKLIIK